MDLWLISLWLTKSCVKLQEEPARKAADSDNPDVRKMTIKQWNPAHTELSHNKQMQQQILMFVTRKSNLTLHEWNWVPHSWAGSCCLSVKQSVKQDQPDMWAHANSITCPHHHSKYQVQNSSFPHLCAADMFGWLLCARTGSWFMNQGQKAFLLRSFDPSAHYKPGRLKLLTCDLRDKNNLASVREKWKKEKSPYCWGRVAISARFRG